MATNRFSAEQGRSAASAVNVVTRSGVGHAPGHRHLPPARRRAAGAARHLRPQRRARRRPSRASSTRPRVGGPIVRGKAWWFGAVEYRNQDAVVQVGERDLATRTIRRGLRRGAPRRPPRPRAGSTCRPRPATRLSFRYVFEDAEDVAGQHARPGDRLRLAAPGRARNRHHQGLATWTRTLGPAAVNTLRASYSDYRNAIEPVTPGPPAHLPEPPGRRQLPGARRARRRRAGS